MKGNPKMGKYVEFIEVPNYLSIKLLPDGREEIESQREGEDCWKKGTNDILLDLLEWQLCNGWEWVEPEDIGALTSAPILRSPNGKIYWFPNYAVTCEIKEMLEKGEVRFDLAE
jgi:hypothetical protein